MRYDMHTHSKYSPDSILEPRAIVKRGRKRGLAGVAVTDHNTIKGGLEAKRYETEDFKVIVGSEIMTDRGEIIGLFLNEEVEPKELEVVSEEIREQGGIVVVPHPFDRIRPGLQPTDEDAKFFDCIEGFNSRCLFQSYNKRAVEFASRHKLPVTAGSDAHFGWEIGNAFIRANADTRSEEELRRDILKNNGIEYEGRLSNPLNQCLSKVLKIWRRVCYDYSHESHK